MTHPMNPEVKQEWLAALRGGHYRQGHGQLARNERYCALGVLCELAVEHQLVSIHEDFHGRTYDGAMSCPPRPVLQWAALPAPEIFINLNDIKLFTFPEIANYIEAAL